MKKNLILIFWLGILFAQVFTEVSQLPDFYSVDPTAIFYNADIDNDGDQDLAKVDPDGYAKFMFFLILATEILLKVVPQ